MRWSVRVHLVSCFVALGARRTADAKARAIALLRHPLRPLQRRSPRPPRLARWETPTVVVLATKRGRIITGPQGRLARAILLVPPQTVLKWHRALVRRKWTVRRRRVGGRPPIAAEVEALLLRLAAEHPRWGDGRLQGERPSAWPRLSRSTVRDVPQRRRVPPAPRRGQRAMGWRQCLAPHRDAVLASDCFTVETVFLTTLYAPFFLELGTRRVHFAGCTAHPTAAWGTPQARNLTRTLHEGEPPVRSRIHDRDAKFPPAFDTIFAAEGVEIIRTPFRAPNANAYAERWIRAARAECLDHVLIAAEAHLRRVLREYVAYYNQARPHQGLEQCCPVALPPPVRDGPVRRRDRLGGLLRDYYRDVA